MFEPALVQFTGTIERRSFDKVRYTCVFLPERLVDPGPGRPRFEGEIAGRPWRGAANPAGDGAAYLLLSASFLRKAGLAMGDSVTVALTPIDPDTVIVPAALAEAFEAAPDLAEVWEGLTPGTRRGFVHRIDSARRPETVRRRVAEVLAALEGDDPSPYTRRR
jgi:hypothetical protein